MNSEPHLAVALTKCFYCGENDRIVLNTRLTKSSAAHVEEMHGKIIDKVPCRKCADYMEQGIIIVTCRDEGNNVETRYRTGGFSVVKEDYIRRLFDDNPEMLNDVLKRRFMFMANHVAYDLGIHQPGTLHE